MPSAGPRWTGEVRFVEEALDLPLRWKKPRRIFVNSMSDLFHEKVADEWIDRIFHVMWQATQHVFQVLTKRPERMLDYMSNPNTPAGKPLPNVWLGVSVENQETADERIPLLLQTPAAVRFLSVEPLLSEVNVRPWLRLWYYACGWEGQEATLMAASGGQLVCPKCGGSGGLLFKYQS